MAQELSDHLHDDRIIRISTSRKLTDMGWTVFANKGFLSEYRKGKKIVSIDLRKYSALPGAHNHQNACAAYAAARAIGIGPSVVEKAFFSFRGLPHRSQLVSEIDGIVFINDSKATNIDSAIKALLTFPNIRWICGGKQKEGDFSKINKALVNVQKAYVIGADSAGYSNQISCDYEICNTMDMAVKSAFRDAKKVTQFCLPQQQLVLINFLLLKNVVRLLNLKLISLCDPDKLYLKLNKIHKTNKNYKIYRERLIFLAFVE